MVWLLFHFAAVAEDDAAEVEVEQRKHYQGFVDIGQIPAQAVDVEQAMARVSRVVN